MTKTFKLLITIILVSASIDLYAQERLSEMPWEKRDSILSTLAINDFKRQFPDWKINYDIVVTCIIQQDNDYYNFEWTQPFHEKFYKHSMSISRLNIPSYTYNYFIRLYNNVEDTTVFVDDKGFADYMITEDLDVYLTSYTQHLTVYPQYNDDVLRKHLKPTRYPKCYKAPTEKELKSDKYMYGKSIASLDKETRINILTAIAQSAVKKKYPQLYRDTVYPVIAEGTFNFLKYKRLMHGVISSVNRENTPRGAKHNDIYHSVSLYYEHAEKEGFAKSCIATVYIADKTREPFLINIGKNAECSLMRRSLEK